MRRVVRIRLRHPPPSPYLWEPSVRIPEIARRCGVIHSSGGTGESGFRVVRANMRAISLLASEASPFISNDVRGQDPIAAPTVAQHLANRSFSFFVDCHLRSVPARFSKLCKCSGVLSSRQSRAGLPRPAKSTQTGRNESLTR